jgi:hypothetical protein
MSPGSIFGNRIALGPNQEEDIFWSTGSSLFRLSLGPAPPPPVAVTNYDGKLLLPTPNERSGKSVAIESLNGAKHSSEIQNLSVVSSDLLHLYSVDSLGQVLVNSFGTDGHNSTVALPAPSSISEHGWVGIASHKALPGICATARYCDKLVTVYDQDRVVSRFKTIAHPMQVRMLDNGMLVMTEQGSFSIWDLRLPSAAILPRYNIDGVGSSGNCVQRSYISSAPLYALDIMNTKVAVAGADRNCVVSDFRTGGVEARWNGCLKYDVTRVNFSRSDPSLCYVSGLDNELLVGRWDGTKGLSHFDGPHIESHWIGISNDNASDTVFGLAQSGHVYICKNTPALLEGVSSSAKTASTSTASAASSSQPKEGSPTVIPHQRQKKKKGDPPPTKKPKLAEDDS